MNRTAHELDHRIVGDDMQCVEITLDPQETVLAEAGAMMMMDEGIEMKTIFGDGNGQEQTLMNKLWGAGKRVLTGESLFMTAYTNLAGVRRTVWFAAAYPGKIIPLDLSDYGQRLICQKDSFLCAAKGVSIGIAFQKKRFPRPTPSTSVACCRRAFIISMPHRGWRNPASRLCSPCRAEILAT